MNGWNYHICALLFRGKTLIRVGINRKKTHPIARRVVKDGFEEFTLHAEMDALIASEPGDTLYVLRVLKDGTTLANAKPCKWCRKVIKDKGIDKVFYTDSEGKFRRL